ncbi:MAG: glycosyltransferase family 39 protein, partial [Candidatus Omnitrophica bacterium]|nr:glycosyltransferase family 39 protein [Candidatus Omnitrophota bacterium]
GKRPWKIVFLILVIALILRACFVFYLKDHFYFDDEYEYWKMVANFISGEGLIAGENLKAYRPPLYPLFLAMLVEAGFGITGIRIVQSVISAMSCVVIFFLSRKIFNEKIAVMASFISCIYPFFIFYSGFLLTETLFVILVLLSVYAFIRLTEPDASNYYGWFAGVITGSAGLCRPTIELFFPFFLLFVLFSKSTQVKKRLIKSMFACIGFIFILSPWIIRNYIVIGKFVPGTTMGGAVFWEGNNPYSEGGPCRYFPEGVWQIEEAKRDQVFYRLTFECIKENPQRFIWLVGRKFLRFWNVVPNASEYRGNLYRFISVASFGLLLPFFVLGMVVFPHNTGSVLLMGLIAFFTLFHMIFLASIRYRLAIEPFVIMFACYGLLWLVERIKKLKKYETVNYRTCL